MEYITVSAKNVDDAITEALVELGITSDQLDYEIIEKGSAGFFGIGMKQAVIKARKKTSPKKNLEKEKKESSFQKKSFEKPEKKERKKESFQKETVGESKEEKETVAKKQPEKEPELAPVEAKTIETCETFIKDVLEAMGMKETTVTSSIDEEGALAIEVAGEGMGVLIGKRGQTLDSIQYLANRVANKEQESYVRVKLDTEDYRRRRKETLEHLAKNIAGKVKRTRRKVILEPMNPYERRIIHSVLQGDPAITTHSEGEEPYRKVVVTLSRK